MSGATPINLVFFERGLHLAGCVVAGVLHVPGARRHAGRRIVAHQAAIRVITLDGPAGRVVGCRDASRKEGVN